MMIDLKTETGATAPKPFKLKTVMVDKEPIDVIPITAYGEIVRTHFRKDNGYIICCGSNCSHCMDNVPQEKYLTPVYVPKDDEVQILQIPSNDYPKSGNPNSTWKKILQSSSSQVVSIARNGFQYTIHPRFLTENDRFNFECIESFVKQFDQGGINIQSVFRTIDEIQLDNKRLNLKEAI